MKRLLALRWKEASFTCRVDCAAIVDANGLVTTRTPRTEPTIFSFRVEPTDSGAVAYSRGGTSWISLGWTCDTARCAVRLDQNGVTVPAMGR